MSLFARELPWKRSAKLWREAAQVWRQTTLEHRGALDALRKQLFERDQDLLALSMKLGETLTRLARAEGELTSNSHRKLFPSKDDGGWREISNDGQF